MPSLGVDPSVPDLGDLSPDVLRRALHRSADWIADYRDGLRDRPVQSERLPGALTAMLPASLPADGASLDALLDEFATRIVPGLVHWGHPAFFGYFGSTTTAPGIVAETLTAALNVSAMMWKVSPAATELEQVVLGWLRELLRLSSRWTGVVYDTASVATLHALAAARERAGGAVRRDGLAGGAPRRVYASAHAHSSIDKAAIVLGIGECGVRRIVADARDRMDVAALATAIRNDRRAGDVPCAVVATVGTTTTAAVDPLPEIAALCRREEVWLHVDAAYGGAMAVLPEGRWVLAGVDEADSLVVNPHKWLFVPLDFSTLYVRDPEALRAVFRLTPDYLAGDAEGDMPNAMDVSLQLGRRFRALKAWMVWRTFGRDGLIRRLREHRRLAQVLAELVSRDPAFELAAPVEMGVVCFRPRDGRDDERTRRLAAAVNRSGAAYVTVASVGGRAALRAALGNVLTTEADVRKLWTTVRTLHDAVV